MTAEAGDLMPLPSSVDVAIIGAGFAGLATARELHRRGVTDVLVVEREAELGRFASGRSAGLGRQLAEHDVHERDPNEGERDRNGQN